MSINNQIRGWIKCLFGVITAFGLLISFSATVYAYSEAECESTGVGGTCRVSCNAGENEVGTCSDAWVQVTCCSKKVIPPGSSLSPTTPSSGGSAPAASAGGSPGSPTTLVDPLGGVTINQLIGRFINIFLGFVGAIALLVFVYAGILYMTGGTSDRIKKAVETMKYAVFGLMIIMFAYVITSFYFRALTSEVPVAPKPKPVTTPQIPNP